ncbi:MAG: ABC transporter permease [Actinomycetaceae bacterium]|nr:ABC transporter permease [Actinomycetaceae bacterium]
MPDDAPLDNITSDQAPATLSRFQLVLRRTFRPLGAKIGFVGLVLIILFAIFGPYVSPWSYADVDNTAFMQGPSAAHWLGTTQGGRDIFAMSVEGLRKSLMIGFSVAIIQTFLAAIIGASAAYFGGAVSKVILWIIDLMLVIPSFLMIAIITQKAGNAKGSIPLFILLLAAFGWMLSARVVRAMTSSVASLDYVQAARFMSVPSRAVIFRHIIPNISSYLIVDFTLGLAAAVLAETSLSFFGFGVQAPQTSLGTMISEGSRMATTFPWVFLAPAVLLVLTLLFVNFLGDAVRDALDPSSNAGGQA